MADVRHKKTAFDKRHKRTQQRLVDRSIRLGSSPFYAMGDQYLREINRLSLKDIADSWFPSLTEDDALVEALYLPMLNSRVMGIGQFWYDLRAVGFDRYKREKGIAIFQTAAEYEEIPPMDEDKIYQWFNSKTPYARPEFDALAQIDKTNAFTIAGVQEIRTVTEIKALAVQSLLTNVSKQEFIKAVEAKFVALGIRPSNRHHIKTVYNTNIHSAYNAGRYIEYFSPLDPDVETFVPAMQYSTTGAANVCAICDPYDGLIYARNDPILQYIYPPNHYNCACTVIPVSVFEIEAEGLQITNKNFITDPDVPQPLPGFDGPPAMIGNLAA